MEYKIMMTAIFVAAISLASIKLSVLFDIDPPFWIKAAQVYVIFGGLIISVIAAFFFIWK